ncbi:hypothetical protein GCM10025734_84000 [Kitasatospora paranensis]
MVRDGDDHEVRRRRVQQFTGVDEPGDLQQLLLLPQRVRVAVADCDEVGPAGGEQAGQMVLERLVAEADDCSASFHAWTPSAS